jgi:hypothetical protein
MSNVKVLCPGDKEWERRRRGVGEEMGSGEPSERIQKERSFKGINMLITSPVLGFIHPSIHLASDKIQIHFFSR